MLLSKGHVPVILDVRAPHDSKQRGVFIQGSIPDRAKLMELLHGCDCIVHIAAWHGIHEIRGKKNAYDFFDLNVRERADSFTDRQKRDKAVDTVAAKVNDRTDAAICVQLPI